MTFVCVTITEDRVGFWKYYFTVHMNEKFDKLIPERMLNTDLEFEYVHSSETVSWKQRFDDWQERMPHMQYIHVCPWQMPT